MKINSIKISNILSFEYIETPSTQDIEKIDSINFDNGLNILIGSNGSGKSNFLEVLNGIFKGLLIKNTIINYQYVNHPTHIKNTIQILPNDTKIEKNWGFEDKEQLIYVCFEVNKEDIKNMLILYENYEKINSIIGTYSSGAQINVNFDKKLITDDLEIKLILKSSDGINFNLSIIRSYFDELCNFLQKYIEFFNLYRDAITIFNEINDEKIINIKNTFFLINAYREYDNIKENLNVNGKKEILEQSKLSLINKSKVKQLNGGEPDIFDLVRIRLGFDCKDNIKKGGVEEMNLQLEENEMYKDINSMLSLINLNFIFNVDADDWNSKIAFIRKSKNINFSGLSSGEKAIVYLAFALYGYHLENGLLIIDEPELHLHPTFQKKYLDILNMVSDKNNIQVILVTHSPSFISPNIIEKVHKFSIDSGSTKIAFPNEGILTDYKDLLRIIHYTNSEKIFFADKIILVEGDSDEYFFKYFLEKVNEENKIKSDIEIIYIGGKKEFKKWNNFLSLFNIYTFYIGDWDNIFNLDSIVEDEEILKNEDYIKIKENLLRINNEYGDNLNKLIKQEKRDKIFSELNQSSIKIIDLVREKSNSNINILKFGDLEKYLGINKGLNNVIDFCDNEFSTWYQKDEGKQNELKEIFTNIIN